MIPCGGRMEEYGWGDVTSDSKREGGSGSISVCNNK